MPSRISKDLEDTLRILRAQGWFSQIAPRFQTALAAEATVFSARKGETVFHFGDPGAGLFGIATGSFVLSVPREDRTLLTLATLGSGYWIGDQAALSGKPGLVSIEVREDVSGLHISANRVRRLVRDMPEIYEAFYQLNRINLALALRLMAALTAETSVEKVAFRLLILSNYVPQEDGWIAMTNEDLATQLGLSVPSIRRAMKQLSDHGFLESGYSRVRITNADAIAGLKKN